VYTTRLKKEIYEFANREKEIKKKENIRVINKKICQLYK